MDPCAHGDLNSLQRMYIGREGSELVPKGAGLHVIGKELEKEDREEEDVRLDRDQNHFRVQRLHSQVRRHPVATCDTSRQ